MMRNQLPSERFYEREYNILKKENEKLKEELRRLEEYHDSEFKRWTETARVMTFDDVSIPLSIIATGEISHSYYGTEIIAKNVDGLRFSYQVSNPELYQTTDKMNAVYFILQEMLLRLFKLKKDED